MTARRDGYLPIAGYAAIGDSRALALVGCDGAIDWMCLPAIDSPSVFAALLDPAGGGSFALAPAAPFQATRRYVDRTNLLQTEYRTAEGVVRVTDGLTIDSSQNAPWRELARRVEGVGGTVPMSWRVRPRFDFAQRSAPPARVGETLVYRHGRLQVALKGWEAGEPAVAGDAVEGRFEIAAGQAALLALLAGEDVALPSPDRAAVERRLQGTETVWRDWVARTTYQGPWRAAVERSLLAIRLLADGRSGAIAAAGTCSLPEVLGGERNYDYRFGWARDLCFTVEALLSAGMEELAHASVCWLLDAVATTHPRVDPLYSLTGQVVRSQRELPLPGYRQTSPVHVGNQAGSQLQLGGFGDLMETLAHYVRAGHILHPETGQRLADSADLLSAIWRSPDAGLWELDDTAHYATSKLGCWTALDRILELVQREQVPDRHVARWRAERDRVREFIERELWSPARGAYVMRAGGDELDCGVLLAARRRFADPAGDRMNGTIDAIRSELHAGGPLFYRYSGMREQENAFLACSFWLVEALALAGRAEQAAEIMDGVVSLGGDLGLYSEEMDPTDHSLMGNFPQALTHLALINAAVALGEAG